MRFWIALSLLTTSLCAQDFERVKPKQPTEYTDRHGATFGPNGTLPHIPDGDQVIIQKLKGIILTDKPSHVSEGEIHRAVGRGEMINVQVPGTVGHFNAMLQNHFLGKPLTRQGLLDLKQEVILYYRRWGRPIVTVEIPEQKISQGILQIVVIEGKLGKVTVEGNNYFKSERLAGAIRLEAGKPIDSNTLVTDLEWINRNPFRRVDVIYAPGEVAGTTDIRLLTEDRRPWRVFAGVDNTGFDETDTTRLFMGANWGNAFGLDHLLSVQLTASPNIDRFWAATGSYMIPLPWRDIWTFYGGYSHVQGDLDTPHMKNTGYAAQGSTRYTFLLPHRPGFLQEFSLGFDFKRTNNNIEFGGQRVYTTSVNLTQLAFIYNVGFDSEALATSLTAELFWSPGDWLPDQSDATYRKVRSQAKSTYIYGRMALIPVLRLPKDFSFALTLRGQVSTQTLLPSEQAGLGGFNTVRGYKEREVNVDNAVLASAELHSPPVSLIGRRSFKDTLECLIFLDYAFGRDVRPIPNVEKTAYLLGVGPGIRYNIAPYLSFRGDLGFQLKKLDSRGFRFHYALVASY